MYQQNQFYQQQQQTANTYTAAPVYQQSYGSHSSYQSAQPATNIPANPVEHYTKCYHGWQAHGKECEAHLNMIPVSNLQGREEAKRRVDWAKYYADQSSRAAHHFYSNPNAPAPFDLPPTPPQSSYVTVPPIQPAQYTAGPGNSTAQNMQGNNKKDDDHTPGSLAKYVKNCLNRCITQEQRKAVQAEIEIKIASAIQKGDMHSQNWDLVPLIPVPGLPSTSTATIPQNQQQNFHEKPKFSGFQIKNPKKSKISKGYADKLPQNDSYYGHSAPLASSPASHVPASSASYYGPVSTDSTAFQSYGSSLSNPASSLQDASYSFTSQKRKLANKNDDFIPLARQGKKSKQKSGFQASKKVLAKRANRFSGPGGISDASMSNAAATSAGGHEKYMGKRLIGGSNKQLDEQDFERMTVKGRCTTLEKEYLRLTAPPRAELVRPQNILEKHLQNLKISYAKEKRKEYLWFCSQLKAIRQDCTVQRIQNEFAVDVYETHARIALGEGDLNEYNQCQTQLKELYQETKFTQNQDEFVAYRLLYYVFLSCNEKYDGGSSDVLTIMLSLTNDQRSHPAIAHGLKVREALAFGDYLSFFRLHAKTPNLGHHLTSLIVPTMRIRGLRRMAKSYRPTLDIEVCTKQLGFDSIDVGKKWLASCGCVLDGPKIVMKDGVIHEPETETKNSLI